MRKRRFTIAQFFLAVTFIALLLGLFTSTWQIAKRDPLATFNRCFSPSGQLFAIRHVSGTINVWRLNDGRPRLLLRAFADGSHPYHTLLGTIRFRDERRLLLLEPLSPGTPNNNNRVIEIDLETGKAAEILRLFNSSQIQWHGAEVAHGRLFVKEHGGTTIHVYDLETKQLDREITIGTLPLWDMSLSADGGTLVLEDDDGNVYLVDTSTCEVTRQYAGVMKSETVSRGIPSAAISGDGKTLVTPGRIVGETGAETVFLFDTKTGVKTEFTTELAGSGAFWTAISRDSSRLYVADDDNHDFYEVASGKRLWRISHDDVHSSLFPDDPWSLSYPQYGFDSPPDGKTFITYGLDCLQIWDVASGKLLSTARGSMPLAPWPLFVLGFAIWAVAWSRVREGIHHAAAPPDKSLAVAIPAASWELKVCWLLMGIGGTVALIVAICSLFVLSGTRNTANYFFPNSSWAAFAYRTWQLLQIFYSFVLGLFAIGQAAVLSRCRLKLTAGMQVLNLLGGDCLNPLLGAVELALFRRKSLRRDVPSQLHQPLLK